MSKKRERDKRNDKEDTEYMSIKKVDGVERICKNCGRGFVDEYNILLCSSKCMWQMIAKQGVWLSKATAEDIERNC